MEQEGEIVTTIDLQQVPLVNGGLQQDSAVEEVNLLLEPSLLKGLKEVAEDHGMTAASLFRYLLRSFLHYPSTGQGVSGSSLYPNGAYTGFGENKTGSGQRYPTTRG